MKFDAVSLNSVLKMCLNLKSMTCEHKGCNIIS
jgi:hypothetical protein